MQFKAWRKEVLGATKRGPVEFSKPASRDFNKGSHDPVTWVFDTGEQLELGAVTQDCRAFIARFLVPVT